MGSVKLMPQFPCPLVLEMRESHNLTHRKLHIRVNAAVSFGVSALLSELKFDLYSGEGRTAYKVGLVMVN